MKQWINFEEVRKHLKLEDLIRIYRLELTQKANSDQFTGGCPLPNHGPSQKKTFSVNSAKGLFQCFGCRQSGNLLDLAVLLEGKNPKNGREVREVALSLQKETMKDERPSPPPTRTAPKEHPKTPSQPLSTVINPPLDFALKTLEREHPYFTEHKLTAETVARFGLGYCKRGTLAGRIAVPLEDDAGQLVGYSGLILDESQVTDATPKYLYPGTREVDGVAHVFDRGKFLYSGFRVTKSVKDLIVVLEPHLVWLLWQAGFANVVGLMGHECSEEQVIALNMLTQEAGRVWLLTDESDASQSCAKELLFRVAANRSCRWVRVEGQEAIAPEHPLLSLLPKR